MAMTTDEIKEKCAGLEAFMAQRGLKDPRVTFSWCATKRWNVFVYDSDGISNNHSYHDKPGTAFILATSHVHIITATCDVALVMTQDDYGDMNDRAEKLAAKWEAEQ